MTEKSIDSLKAQLVMLGFEPDVETILRCHLCFAPVAFDIKKVRSFGGDSCLFTVHIGRVGDKAPYSLQYYQATLRKNVVVPEVLLLLDRKMGQVPWERLLAGKQSYVEIDRPVLQSAAEVIAEMDKLGVVANLLKYKYWVGTALEPLIGGLAALRGEWEISERFYFFDDVSVISFSDALRFLGSRWMEKQVAAQRKLLLKKNEAEGGGTAGAGKLLAKKVRRGTRLTGGGK